MTPNEVMPTEMDTEKTRVTARVPVRLRDLLEEAAELSGATLSQFVVSAAMERAQQIVGTETIIHLSREQARRMCALMDAPPKPNKSLKQAFKRHRGLFGAS